MSEQVVETPSAPPPANNPDPSPAPETPPDKGASAAPAKPDSAPPPDKSLGLGGGKPDPVDQVVPADWPEDWREKYAGGDETDLKSLRRYKDPANVWKAYKALRSRMDAGEFQRVRPEGDDEKALAEWRTEREIPADAKGYFEGLPEGLVIDDADKPIIERYAELAHKSDATPQEFARGLEHYYALKQEQAETQANEDKDKRAKSEDVLRAAWGPEYRPNLNNMHALFDSQAPEGLREQLFTARLEDGTLLGDHPDFLSFMVGVAKEVNPFGTVAPGVGPTQSQNIDSEIAALQREMSDTKGHAGPDSYWNNPGKQERFRQLLDAKARLSARAG